MAYLLPARCLHCDGPCVRKGKYKGAQLLRCGACERYQRGVYRHQARMPGTDGRIITLVREGCGIRGIGRVLSISPGTVIARIKSIGARLRPTPIKKGRAYEVDELATFVGNKQNRTWVAYAWEPREQRVVALRIGKRSQQHLRPLIETLLLAEARRIRTDGLDIYRSLVPAGMHRARRSGTNGIERMNLTLRTRLKRLTRRTICYSKSAAVLAACVAIACWGRPPKETRSPATAGPLQCLGPPVSGGRSSEWSRGPCKAPVRGPLSTRSSKCHQAGPARSNCCGSLPTRTPFGPNG